MKALKNVTLCSITSRDVEVTEYALRKSMQSVEFKRVMMFSPRPPTDPRIEHIKIPLFTNMKGYCNFVLFDLHKYIDTEFALITHFDGFVINPQCWDDSFLNFDYIGASWPWHRENAVGNGGFNLRSAKFLKATNNLVFDSPSIPEDTLICREKREVLNSQGLSFAPVEVADRFSLEHAKLPLDSFGFHGLFHLHRVYNEKELDEVVSLFNPVIYTEAPSLSWFFTLQNEKHRMGAIVARLILENQTFKTMTKNCAVFSLNPIRVFNELTEAAKF